MVRALDGDLSLFWFARTGHGLDYFFYLGGERRNRFLFIMF
jgi:hypothetical protein